VLKGVLQKRAMFLKMGLKMVLGVTLLIPFILVGNRIVDLHAQFQLNLQDGLVAYWKFDEGEGDIAFDETENHNDGALLCDGETCLPPKRVDGKAGFAIELDGVSNYMLVSNHNLHTNNITIVAWIRQDLDLHLRIVAIIGNKVNQNVEAPGWVIAYNGYRKTLQAIISDGIRQIIVEGAFVTWDKQWHQVVLIIQRDQAATLYLDDLKLGSVTIQILDLNKILHDPSSIWIGRFRYGGHGTGFFRGLIDEVRIYDRALSQREVMMLFHARDTHSKYPLGPRA
jgi:hypothetical protein